MCNINVHYAINTWRNGGRTESPIKRMEGSQIETLTHIQLVREQQFLKSFWKIG